MGRIRPELMKGIVVLSMFLILIIPVQLLQPYPISNSEYTSVDLQTIKMNPPQMEEFNISSHAIVESLLVMRGASLIFTIEDVTLQIRSDILYRLEHIPAFGDHIYFRGTLHNFSNPHVVVHEFYMLDYSSSLIRSIPGIILFLVLFFHVFTTDFKRLAFLPRRRNDA